MEDRICETARDGPGLGNRERSVKLIGPSEAAVSLSWFLSRDVGEVAFRLLHRRS